METAIFWMNEQDFAKSTTVALRFVEVFLALARGRDSALVKKLNSDSKNLMVINRKLFKRFDNESLHF